jgi:hypothetical protein
MRDLIMDSINWTEPPVNGKIHRHEDQKKIMPLSIKTQIPSHHHMCNGRSWR